MASRGLYEFEVTRDGHLEASPTNLEKMRKLFLDRQLLTEEQLGPGDPGDFDFGAWHVLCHLAGATAVLRGARGELLSLELVHVPSVDVYTAGVTVATRRERVATFPVGSTEGRSLVDGARLLGFVEGTSLGRISARDVADPPDRFNKWQRQAFDHPVTSRKDGGRVWEHWCTVRDIRPGAQVGLSVLRGYLEMLAVCGGTLAATVARGRRQYNHPDQLVALIKGGLVSAEDALLETTPSAVPRSLQRDLHRADPGTTLQAAAKLEWPEPGLRYYMFKRRIRDWSGLASVRRDLRAAGVLPG